MIAVLTLLLAFPLGWAVRNRLAGYLVYGLAFAHVFTFQTAVLVMEWVDGADAAFAQSGAAALWESALGYMGVTTAVYAAGFGLLTLGQRLRLRRDSRRDSVQLQPAG